MDRRALCVAALCVLLGLPCVASSRPAQLQGHGVLAGPSSSSPSSSSSSAAAVSPVPDACNAPPTEPYDLYLHIGAVFILLGTSFLATVIPVVGKSHPRLRISDYAFALGKNFGTGVILATGFIHMLMPAAETLTNECLPAWFTKDYRAFAGLLALFACLSVQFVQSLAMVHTRRRIEERKRNPDPLTKPLVDSATDDDDREVRVMNDVLRQQQRGRGHGHHHEHGDEEEGHVHTMLLDKENSRRVSTYMLELGIVMHSVIIGLTLGVTRGEQFQGLLIAICCHQFFEGIALSTTVLDSGFTTLLQPMLVVLFYSCTTPTGIAIGIGISKSYNANSVSALLVQGCFDGVSAGVLIYDGLVNLLTANITNSREFAMRSVCGRIGIYVAVWMGAAAMAIVGRWA
eukprot:m51a1_g9101 hypothetical protein (402) ;mRNA; r:76630-78371